MSNQAPPGWHSVTPRLFAADLPALVSFLRHAFDAEGELHADRPAELRLGDSMVMVSSDEVRGPMPAFLYLYVEDADATYRRALEAGAVSLEAPREVPYGDRRCMVRDPGGNIWQIATRLKP